MNPDSNILRANDAHYIFNGLEQLALIAIVIIVAKVVLAKPGLFSKRLQRVLWVLIALWAVAVAVQFTADAYNYVHTIRQLYTEARHSQTGL